MDVKNWHSNDVHFRWDYVASAIATIDSTSYGNSIKLAHELLLDSANDCVCGRSAPDLFWVCVATDRITWESGDGSVGFLTICDECQRQVDYLVDEELTRMQKDEFERSGILFE